MSPVEKIPLKAFWESVEQRLVACSADELRAILRVMAQETPPAERATFLEKLRRFEEASLPPQQTIQQEDLLAEPPETRPQTLFGQMQQMQSGLIKPRLMLDDLIQISPRPLPDREKFFVDWLAFLRTQSGSEADTWLREAIRLSQGTPGLALLARTEGRTRPRAFQTDLKAAVQRMERGLR